MALSGMSIQDGIIFWYDGPEWDEAVRESFENSRDEVEDYARSNAIWEDRTGDARAGLRAEVEDADGIIALDLGHTVDYGLWLEVIQNGRFAIIMPTLEALGPQIIADAAQAAFGARSGVEY